MKMSKIIIFEGADMVGKSNIAKELGKRLKINIYKNTLEQNRWKDHLISLMYGMEELVQFLEQIGSDVIFDRFHGSEYSYSKEFKRYTCENKIWDLDERLANLKTTIIYLEKDSEFYLEDNEDIVKIEQYDRLKNNYDDFLKKTKCKVIRLNTNNQDLKAQVNYILENI